MNACKPASGISLLFLLTNSCQINQNDNDTTKLKT